MVSAALFGCSDRSGGDGDIGSDSSTDSGGSLGNGPRGGQIGGVDPVCDSTAEPIGLDDVSPLGRSANDVVSALSGARSATLTWAKGGSTTVTVSVGTPVAARSITYHGRPDAAGGGGPDNTPTAPIPCWAPELEIDVPLSFSTEDGAFDESLSVTLVTGQIDAVRLSHELSLSEIQGSYQVSEVDPSELDDVRLHLSGEFRGSDIHGSLRGHPGGGSSGSGGGPGAGVPWFDIAEF